MIANVFFVNLVQSKNKEIEYDEQSVKFFNVIVFFGTFSKILVETDENHWQNTRILRLCCHQFIDNNAVCYAIRKEYRVFIILIDLNFFDIQNGHYGRLVTKIAEMDSLFNALVLVERSKATN